MRRTLDVASRTRTHGLAIVIGSGGSDGALSAVGEAIGGDGFAGEGSSDEGDGHSQFVRGLVAAEFASGGPVDEGDVSFLASCEDDGWLLEKYKAVNVGTDARSGALVEFGQRGEQIRAGESAQMFDLTLAIGRTYGFCQS